MKLKTLLTLIFVALVLLAACKPKPDELAGDEPKPDDQAANIDSDAGAKPGKADKAPGHNKADKTKKKADPDMGPADDVDAG